MGPHDTSSGQDTPNSGEHQNGRKTAITSNSAKILQKVKDIHGTAHIIGRSVNVGDHETRTTLGALVKDGYVIRAGNRTDRGIHGETHRLSALGIRLVDQMSQKNSHFLPLIINHNSNSDELTVRDSHEEFIRILYALNPQGSVTALRILRDTIKQPHEITIAILDALVKSAYIEKRKLKKARELAYAITDCGRMAYFEYKKTNPGLVCALEREKDPRPINTDIHSHMTKKEINQCKPRPGPRKFLPHKDANNALETQRLGNEIQFRSSQFGELTIVHEDQYIIFHCPSLHTVKIDPKVYGLQPDYLGKIWNVITGCAQFIESDEIVRLYLIRVCYVCRFELGGHDHNGDEVICMCINDQNYPVSMNRRGYTYNDPETGQKVTSPQRVLLLCHSNFNDVHASHLCHGGFRCIRPEHIVPEPAHVNTSRNACSADNRCAHIPRCLLKGYQCHDTDSSKATKNSLRGD